MRLYKKAAAALLAAVMAVSMLTACGGGGSSSGGSSNGGGSGTGGNGGNGGNNNNTGTGTNISTDFDESTTGGTAKDVLDNAQQISYGSSMTKNAFGSSYTYEYNANFGDYGDETGNFEANMMTTTDGNRIYSGGTGTMGVGGLNVTSRTATLSDKKENKRWVINLDEGTYTEGKYIDEDTALDKDLLQKARFYKGTYTVGSRPYDAEAFSVVTTEDGITMTLTEIFCYEGTTPKYIISRGYALGGLYDEEVMDITIKSYSPKARTEFLDFETILSNYTPAS